MGKLLTNKRRMVLYNLLGFLLNPFLTIVFFIRKFSRIPNPKTLIILFSGFIGFAYFITPGADVYRYIEFFENYNINFPDFFNDIISRYDQAKTGKLDFYLDLISLFVKLFTNNFRVFLIVLGLVFGVFYAKYLLAILKKVKKINVITGVYIFFFVIAINPQLGIKSRFYVASACSLAGFYGFFMERRKRDIFLIVLSPFIHLGTIGFFVLYLVFYFIKNKPLAALILALVSLGVSGIDLSNYANSFSELGLSGVDQKLENYTNERMQDRYDARFGDEAIWFLKYRARFFFSAAIILLTYFYVVNLNKFDKRTRELFVAALLAVAFWHFINSFPMVYRYEPLLVVLISSFFVQLNGNLLLSKEQKKIQYFLIPFMGLFVAISFRNFLGAIPVHFFISNPLIEGFMESSRDIYSFIIS